MKNRFAIIFLLTAIIAGFVGGQSEHQVFAAPEDATYQTLPFSQDWTNTGLITSNDDWFGVSGIQGFRGDGLTAATDTNPQMLLTDDTPGVIDVNANEMNPNTFTTGGVTEFDIADDVVALAGSGTADAPYIQFYLNTTGWQNIQISYNLRDIDGSTDIAVQQVALHYRVGTTGAFTNVPAGYVADATSGPSLASLVTPVNVTLPAAVNNQAQVQIRIMTTNASGNDEWVGVDDIVVTGDPLTYHSITFDGTVTTSSEWDADSELLGTATANYYLTWDSTYLYAAITGGDTANDKYNLLIDIDPDDTGAANSGTTTNFCGATFGGDGKPDYAVQKYPGGVARVDGTSGSWAGWTPVGGTDAASGTNQTEFRVQWSDIGVNTRATPVAVYLYTCNNGNLVWSAWPPENPQWTGSTQELPSRTYLPTTDSGRFPRTYGQHRGDQTQFDANGSFNLLGGFAQINITSGGGAGCTFRVDMRGNAVANVNDNAVRRLYTLTPSGCAPTADITLKYLDGTEYGEVDELNGHTESSLVLYRWNGSTWVNEGGTVNATNNSVSRLGVSTFSPWTFADTDAPTALTLTQFSAKDLTSYGLFPLLGLLLVSTALLWARKRLHG